MRKMGNELTLLRKWQRSPGKSPARSDAKVGAVINSLEVSTVKAVLSQDLQIPRSNRFVDLGSPAKL